MLSAGLIVIGDKKRMPDNPRGQNLAPGYGD
jgi:hypothetical protein